MKFLFITLLTLVIISPALSGAFTGWKNESPMLDDFLKERFKGCLAQITEKDSSLNFVGAEITNNYLLMKQQRGGNLNRALIRTVVGNVVRLVHIVYKYETRKKKDGGDRFKVMSYAVLDNSAEFTNLSGPVRRKDLKQAIEDVMEVLNTEVRSTVDFPFLSVYVAENFHGVDFFYVRTTVRGRDGRSNLYEFWFRTYSTEEEHDYDDLEFFAYDISKTTQSYMENAQKSLTNFSKNSTCSQAPSFFLCSLLPQCDIKYYRRRDGCFDKK